MVFNGIHFFSCLLFVVAFRCLLWFQVTGGRRNPDPKSRQHLTTLKSDLENDGHLYTCLTFLGRLQVSTFIYSYCSYPLTPSPNAAYLCCFYSTTTATANATATATTASTFQEIAILVLLQVTTAIDLLSINQKSIPSFHNKVCIGSYPCHEKKHEKNTSLTHVHS